MALVENLWAHYGLAVVCLGGGYHFSRLFVDGLGCIPCVELAPYCHRLWLMGMACCPLGPQDRVAGDFFSGPRGLLSYGARPVYRTAADSIRATLAC